MAIYTPTDFVISVYETKTLAEQGDETNALYVFRNVGDGSSDSSNPTISNGSQYIAGTADGDTTNKLIDSSAGFSDRLVGKIAKNLTDNTEGVITSVDSATQLGFASDVFPDGNEIYHIEKPGFYFTFTKYYYRIQANDIVKGFIIDWDDGEDNSPEKANRQTIMLDEPNSWVVVEHTYTKHGKFYPMIRTISVDGFYSKWYVSHDAKDSLSSIEEQYSNLSAGQNDWSTISLDVEQSTSTSSKPRIPEFVPANIPPIANLQVDRKSVFSGIDNSKISGNAIGYIHSPRNISNFTDALEVIYKTTTGRILKETIDGINNTQFPSDTSTNGYLSEVLSVKIIKMKEGTSTSTDLLGPDQRIYILYHTSSPSVTSDEVITMVSLGNPIQTLDRPGFSILADGSMSQTKCSNVSISQYIFDTGKLQTSASSGEWFVKSDPDEISDVIRGNGTSDSEFAQTNDKKRIHYSFKPNTSGGHVIDNDNKRFYNEERLIRLQVKDSSEDTFADTSTLYYDADSVVDLSFNVSNQSGLNNIRGWKYGWTSGSALAANMTGIVVARASISYYSHFRDNLTGVTHLKIGSEYMRYWGFSVRRHTSGGSFYYVLNVTRGVGGTTAASHSSGTDIYKISRRWRTPDTTKHSFIEHFQYSMYADEVNRPENLRSRGLLLKAHSASASGANTLGDEVWTLKDSYNNQNYFAEEGADDGNDGLLFGGIKKSDDYSTMNVTQLTHGGTNGHRKRPSNWLLCCKTDKFNKLFFRMTNEYVTIDTEKFSNDIWPDKTDANIILYYTALEDETGSTYIWKPLPFVDGTSSNNQEGQSLRKSGSITFNMPNDWVKAKSSDITSWAGDTGNPVPEQEASTVGEEEQCPANFWQDDMYGLLIGIAVNGELTDWQDKVNCNYMLPYNNSHSSAITIKDPHHKSLNDITIAQSISWNRQSRLMNITDRLGRNEIRKIGAEGGKITFGGVELGGDSYTTTKAAIMRYQEESVPVYLDVERTNGDFIRFYGVIASLSEDVPAGKATPKWGVSMQVEYIAQFTSSGSWINNGLISLGGEVIDEPKYLL